jgi:hypothetical protein
MSEHLDESQPAPGASAGESTDDLLAVAAAHGSAVSRRQLAEWHRADLLPTPEQTYGDKAGSTSIYPAGTAQRLLALCDCRKRSPRSLDDTAWCLWWAGFDVPERYIRGQLVRAAALWRELTDELRQLLQQGAAGDTDDALADTNEDDELTNRLEVFLKHMSIVRSPRKAFAQMRRRVGREKFPTVVRVLAEIGTGTFEGYRADAVTGTTDDEREIVETALDFTRARTDRLVGVDPWLTGDTEQTFATLSRLIRDHPPGSDLDEVGIEELARTRDEAQLFKDLFTGLGSTVEQMFGRGAFGFTAFGALAHDESTRDQAIWVLLWRMIRRAELGAAIELMLPLAQQWQETMLPTMAALQQLRAEVPATAELFHPKQIGRGLRSKREQQRRGQALQRLRAEHAPELDAFIAQHPEVPRLEADEHARETHESPTPSKDECT